MLRRIAMLLLLSVVALAAACSSQPQAVEFTIEMNEFAYEPSEIEVFVGQEVTIHLVNHGALEHELMIGREVVMNDGLPADFKHNMFEDTEPHVVKSGEDHGHEDGDEHMDEGEMDEHMDEEEMDEHMDEGGDDHGHAGHGFMVSLPGNHPDDVTTITFTVTEDMVGEWELGCFLDRGSHFTAGMNGTLVVSP